MIEIVNCSKCMVMPVITRRILSELGRYYSTIQCPVCKKNVTGLSDGYKATQRDADIVAIEEWNAHEWEH